MLQRWVYTARNQSPEEGTAENWHGTVTFATIALAIVKHLARIWRLSAIRLRSSVFCVTSVRFLPHLFATFFGVLCVLSRLRFALVFAHEGVANEGNNSPLAGRPRSALTRVQRCIRGIKRFSPPLCQSPGFLVRPREQIRMAGFHPLPVRCPDFHKRSRRR
jgi:hypothetical protein